MPQTYEGSNHGEGMRIAVIASRFHQAVVDRLLEGALECLERHGVAEKTTAVFRVPGAFEIPTLAAELARSGKYDALVTIGVLIRGDTPHFDFLSAQVTNQVSRVSIDSRIPISFGVITCNTMEQAMERTERGNNKGWEAALAAVEMARLFGEIRGKRAREEGNRGTGRQGRLKSPAPLSSSSPPRRQGR